MKPAIKRVVEFIIAFPILAFSAFAAEPHWLAGEMAEAGPHPRCLMLPEDIETVRARIAREPYLGLFRSIHSLALRDVDPSNHELGVETSRAGTARAAALLFLLDRALDETGMPAAFADAQARRAMGGKAATCLLNMNTRSRAKGIMDATLDIHTAEELQLWADTLDLLRGADEDPLGADRGKAVQNVADLAADFWADYEVSNWRMLRSEVANHRSKSAAALGVAAMALNGENFEAKASDGRYDPARWIDFALRYTDLVVRDILDDADGGFQEGCSYLHYSGVNHVPFLRAWHRYTGGASYDVDWSDTGYYRLHARGTYILPDMWTDPWLDRQILWAAKIMLPDGSLPPFDDSSPGARFFFGAFVSPEFANASLFRWAWEKTGFTTGGSVDPSPMMLVAFDDSIPSKSPEEVSLSTSAALPYAGQVVFRSGWEPDDVYALLMCEHGKAAAWVQTRWGDYIDGAAGHEHPDGASFMLYAYGEPLAIDSGYLGWENHAKVNKPRNHNTILVDGKGPKEANVVVPRFEINDAGAAVFTNPEQEGGWAPAKDGLAYLTAADMENEGALFAEVFASYFEEVPPAEIRRRAAFLADRFLVLRDSVAVKDEGGAPHAVTFQLHGNGGATSGGGFSLLPNGGLWTREKARMRAVVLSGAEAAYSTRECIHDAAGWQEKTHTALDVTARTDAEKPAAFLAVLIPEPSDGQGGYESVETETGGCEGGVCVKWNVGELSCSAWNGYPMEVKSGDNAILTASEGAYCRSGGRIAGYFSGSGDNSALLLTAGFDLDEAGKVKGWRAFVHRNAGAAVFDMPAIEGLVPDGACSYSQEGSMWKIRAPAGATISTVESANPVVAALRLAGLEPGKPAAVPFGSEAVLDASESCHSGGADLKYAWEVTAKPELSTVSGAAEGPVFRFTPDLPGLYRVAVRVQSGASGAETETAFEVEGEPGWENERPNKDAGVEPAPDAGDQLPSDNPSAGCSGCASAGQPFRPILCAVIAAFAAFRRRMKQAPEKKGSSRWPTGSAE